MSGEPYPVGSSETVTPIGDLLGRLEATSTQRMELDVPVHAIAERATAREIETSLHALPAKRR